MSRLIHVQSRPHYKPFCAALVLNDKVDRVIATAPALRFMEKWTIGQVIAYCAKHGWMVDRQGEYLK